VDSPYFCPIPSPVLVAIACRRYSACNGIIINLEGGPDLIWPSLNFWAGFDPPPKKGMLGRDQPNDFGPISAHPFAGCARPS